MNQSSELTSKFILRKVITFGVIVVLMSIQIIFSPYLFVKGLNTVVVLFVSGTIGAFIREIFFLRIREKEKASVSINKYTIIRVIIFCILLIYQAFQIVTTPHTFIRVISLIAVVFVSGVIGAIIRELFIQKSLRKMERSSP